MHAYLCLHECKCVRHAVYTAPRVVREGGEGYLTDNGNLALYHES